MTLYYTLFPTRIDQLMIRRQVTLRRCFRVCHCVIQFSSSCFSSKRPKRVPYVGQYLYSERLCCIYIQGTHITLYMLLVHSPWIFSEHPTFCFRFFFPCVIVFSPFKVWWRHYLLGAPCWRPRTRSAATTTGARPWRKISRCLLLPTCAYEALYCSWQCLLFVKYPHIQRLVCRCFKRLIKRWHVPC